jgi:ribulose-bisphosphate carboxylase large chain
MSRKEEFVDLNYIPKKDLICLFRIEPEKKYVKNIKDAANTVALESSIGTWVDVKTKKDYVNKLAAKVFEIKNNWVKIAYPQDLFELGNVPNILSSIAGNILGMKAVKNLRLEDIKIPKKLLNSFKGPRHGIGGIRRILKVKKRPLVGTIVKPKLGLKTKDHAKVAYNAWVGGCDLVKDDENLASQKFNKFEKRAAKTLEMKDRAEEETGEKKLYLINVTAETQEMLRRADIVKEQGGKFVMNDILTSGFASLQTLRENTKLGIHAHRAMHGAFTENPKHGISMMSIAIFSRLIGVDSLHIGTGIGKMKGGVEEIKKIRERIEERSIKDNKLKLGQDWDKIKPVMAVCSGGLSPLDVPFLIKNFGKDIIIQAGGGIHGHPSGSKEGGRAMRQALDSVIEGKSLKKYSKNHDELKEALEFWK